jgi:hypothetical protein
MRSRLTDLPRKARALFHRGGTQGASGRTVLCAWAHGNYELLDDRGDHLGTIRTAQTDPTFGPGAPTYFLTRLLRRACNLGSRVRDRSKANAEPIPMSEDQQS